MALLVNGFQPTMIDLSVDLRGADVAVTEQLLNDTQVSSPADQVRRETMPQRVRVNVLMREPSTLSRVLTCIPDDLSRDRPSSRMPTVAGEKPLGRLATKSAPVIAKCIEQSLTQHHVTVAVRARRNCTLIGRCWRIKKPSQRVEANETGGRRRSLCLDGGRTLRKVQLPTKGSGTDRVITGVRRAALQGRSYALRARWPF